MLKSGTKGELLLFWTHDYQASMSGILNIFWQFLRLKFQNRSAGFS